MNINGIQSSLAQLIDFLHRHEISVACIQESKLKRNNADPVIPGYSVIRKDRPRNNGGGGLLILVQYTGLDTSQIEPTPDQTHAWPLELLAVTVILNNAPMNIFNVYIPPMSRDRNYRPDLSPLLNFSDSDSFIGGDLNAHHVGWFSATNGDETEARGNSLIEEILASEYVILNEDIATRQPSAGPNTSPDVSLISAHLATSVSWKAITDLNSDHLPIIIEFEEGREEVEENRRTYVNMNKAD